MCLSNAYRYSQIQPAPGGAVLTEELARESVFYLQSPQARSLDMKKWSLLKLKRVPKKEIQWGRALHLLYFVLACSTGAFSVHAGSTSWLWLYHPAATCEILGLMCPSPPAWAWGSLRHSKSFASCEQQCFVLSQAPSSKLRTAYTALTGVDLCFCCPSTRCNCMSLRDLALQLERSLISKFRLAENIKFAETFSSCTMFEPCKASSFHLLWRHCVPVASSGLM